MAGVVVLGMLMALLDTTIVNVAFSVATVAMVGAIVLMARADSDWADAGGVAAMLAAATLILAEIMRELRDEGDPFCPPSRLAP